MIVAVSMVDGELLISRGSYTMNKSVLLSAVCCFVFTLTTTKLSATTLNMTASLPDVANVTEFSAIDGMLLPSMVNFDGSLDTIIISFNDMKFVEFSGGTAPLLSIGLEFVDETGSPPPLSPVSIGTLSLLGASQEVMASSGHSRDGA